MNNNLIYGEKTVIFEDENIKVIYKNGKADFLFVTFGDLVSLANGLNIYADPVSTKLGYSSLGFMPKSGNWYPPSSMNKAIHISREIINSFHSVLLYGGSMGGYAAIKYSKKIGASYTIACCPQWSISPIECNGNNSGYDKYFKPYMADMGIISDDISGCVYVLYDPQHEIDSFHFSKIRNQSENVVGIKTPFIGHSVTTAVSGTNNMALMIASAVNGDHVKLQQIVCQIRRKGSYRSGELLKSASLKHPYWVAKIILKHRYNSASVAEALDTSISSFIKTKNFEKLREISELIDKNDPSLSIAIAKDLINDILISLRSKGNLISFHGRMLMCNLLTMTLAQKNHDMSNSPTSLLHPVSIIEHGNKQVLGIIKNGNAYIFTISNNTLSLNTLNIEENSESLLLTVNESTDGLLFVNHNTKFITAEPNGNVKFSAPHVKAWELFKRH